MKDGEENIYFEKRGDYRRRVEVPFWKIFLIRVCLRLYDFSQGAFSSFSSSSVCSLFCACFAFIIVKISSRVLFDLSLTLDENYSCATTL